MPNFSNKKYFDGKQFIFGNKYKPIANSSKKTQKKNIKKIGKKSKKS